MDYPDPNCISSNKINTISEELEIQDLKHFLLLLLEVINILILKKKNSQRHLSIFFILFVVSRFVTAFLILGILSIRTGKSYCGGNS